MTKALKQTITLGFIGLGPIGLPIAINLLKAGYQLRVYNRTQQKAAPVIGALGTSDDAGLTPSFEVTTK
jgi:3-hydroxyisobutyrate dehydrogenase-like beta-hydroxyacid dehydrogenase